MCKSLQNCFDIIVHMQERPAPRAGWGSGDMGGGGVGSVECSGVASASAPRTLGRIVARGKERRMVCRKAEQTCWRREQACRKREQVCPFCYVCVYILYNI